MEAVDLGSRFSLKKLQASAVEPSSRCAIGEGLVEETVAVHRLPLQGNEKIAIDDIAAVHLDARDLEMIMDIPVKLSVELGRTRITIKQLLELAQGSVVELDGLAGEPMDILINGYLIAQGEVVVVEDKYGIRITEIITPSERVQKLNR